MGDVIFRLATILAVVTGTGGFVLAVLAWKCFRNSPFGRGLAILVPFMAAFTAYHALLLAVPNLPLLVLGIESLAFVLVVVFVGVMVRLHYQRLRAPRNEVSSR